MAWPTRPKILTTWPFRGKVCQFGSVKGLRDCSCLPCMRVEWRARPILVSIYSPVSLGGERCIFQYLEKFSKVPGLKFIKLLWFYLHMKGWQISKKKGKAQRVTKMSNLLLGRKIKFDRRHSFALWFFLNCYHIPSLFYFEVIGLPWSALSG